MNRLTPIAAALLALNAAPSASAQTTAKALDPATRHAAPATASAPGTTAATTGAAAAATTTVAAAADAGRAAGGVDAGVVAGGAQRVTIEGAAAGDFLANGTSLGKLPIDLHDVPQSVTVINKALLDTQGATSLADALRNVAGITLGGAEGGQIGNNINLNGFTARTDIYFDGFRDRGQYFRDTFALDAVEDLMGPSSMLFGRGSTGGVINQVPKKAQLKDLTAATASVTTNGQVRFTGDIDRAVAETAAVRVSVMAQDGSPTTRDVMENRDYGVAPTLRMGIGTPTEITLSALLQRNRDMPDYGVSPLNGHPANVARNNFYGYTDDRTNQEVSMVSALVQHRFAQDTLVRNQLQLNTVRTDARETASQTIGTIEPGRGFVPLVTPGVSDLPLDQLAVRLQSHDRVITDQSVSDQMDLTTRVATGAVSHNLLLGAEIVHDTYENQNYARNGGTCDGVPLGGTSGYIGCTSLLEPTYEKTPSVPLTVTNLAHGSANSYAAYVGDTAEFGPHFKLVGGLRRDRFSADVENSITNPKAVSQSIDFTSVRAGVIWAPTLAHSYYASYSTSFNPSLEQLTNTTGTTAPLPPEENRAYEVGGRWDAFGGRTSFSGAVFQIEKQNARSQNSDGTYTATGTVRVRGARLGGAGEITPTWKIFAGYAFLDADIVDAIAVGTQGKVPGNTPRNSATLWTIHDVARHWEVGGGAVYQSERFANNTNTVQVGGYARWDGTIAYKQRNYDVRLNLFNIFDRHYYDNLVQSDGGRSVPGTGRSAMLSVSYHL